MASALPTALPNLAIHVSQCCHSSLSTSPTSQSARHSGGKTFWTNKTTFRRKLTFATIELYDHPTTVSSPEALPARFVCRTVHFSNTNFPRFAGTPAWACITSAGSRCRFATSRPFFGPLNGAPPVVRFSLRSLIVSSSRTETRLPRPNNHHCRPVL